VSRVTVEIGDGNARGQKTRALIVTVYGLYARETGGWMSVASVIQLLAECGVDGSAVRSSIYRLKRRGLLVALNVDGVAGYGLSGDARVILDQGDRRIFDRRRASADEGWVLAVFSVPESERDKRHQLRSRLAWLGFGTVSAGVWIAPAQLLDEAREIISLHRLDGYVDLFRADHLAFADTADRVPAWWDLDHLRDLYATFLDRYGPLLAGYRHHEVIDSAQAFTDYVSALTEWRQLPYQEPGLPAEMLPADWIGIRAADTFFELRSLLAAPAHRFVDSVRHQVRTS
jgi:phenylacetic acid degradation operon negative regulatory protein